MLLNVLLSLAIIASDSDLGDAERTLKSIHRVETLQQELGLSDAQKEKIKLAYDKFRKSRNSIVGSAKSFGVNKDLDRITNEKIRLVAARILNEIGDDVLLRHQVRRMTELGNWIKVGRRFSIAHFSNRSVLDLLDVEQAKRQSIAELVKSKDAEFDKKVVEKRNSLQASLTGMLTASQRAKLYGLIGKSDDFFAGNNLGQESEASIQEAYLSKIEFDPIAVAQKNMFYELKLDGKERQLVFKLAKESFKQIQQLSQNKQKELGRDLTPNEQFEIAKVRFNKSNEQLKKDFRNEKFIRLHQLAIQSKMKRSGWFRGYLIRVVKDNLGLNNDQFRSFKKKVMECEEKYDEFVATEIKSAETEVYRLLGSDKRAKLMKLLGKRPDHYGKPSVFYDSSISLESN